jgi:hypothetical protein
MALRASYPRPDYQHRRRLRASRKRPRRHAGAEQCDELAPPQIEHATFQCADHGTFTPQ